MGGYFTENPEVASGYAKRKRGRDGLSNPTVYPVLLSINNPLDMNAPADTDQWTKAFEEFAVEGAYGESAYVSKDDFKNVKTNEGAYRVIEEAMADALVSTGEGGEIMQDVMREMVYDGLTHIGGNRPLISKSRDIHQTRF